MTAIATSADPTEIRCAVPDDLTWAEGVLGRAFEDDPVWEWVLPATHPRRLERLSSLMRLFVEAHLHDGEVYVTKAQTAVGVWSPPGTWRVPLTFYLRKAPQIVGALGLRRLGSLRGLAATEKAHPHEPHHYLALLGTDPAHQGHGAGGQLIRKVTGTADAEGIGCYLESSKASNLPYYGRFGFEVTGEFHLPDGPPMWFMWREPRTSPDFDALETD